MTIQVEASTNLYPYKKFKSLLGNDPLDGVIKYEKFSSGVSCRAETVLNMPAQ